MLTMQFTYQLIRSARRTLSLEITEEGNLIVRAPQRAPMRDIENLLQEKERWIVRHQQQARQKTHSNPPKQFVDSEKFFYLGQEYSFNITTDNQNSFYFDHGFFMTVSAIPKARQILMRWYCEKAYEHISQQVRYFASIHGLNYQGIRITNPKHRWGSCNPDNQLSFNWRLIMAPESVINYVIVHELVHTVHKNHRKRFWQKVEKIMPDYKIQRRWLRDQGHLLTL